MTNPRQNQTPIRSMIVALALGSLFGCTQGGDPDAVSGSSTDAAVGSTTGVYGSASASEPSTSWGTFDPYHTHCTGRCLSGGGI